MKLVKLIFPALTLCAGLVITSTNITAKMEYSKKEKKPCITCHTKNGSKELNDVGKQYAKTKKLEEKK